MKAAVINEFGGPEVIQIADVPKPVPQGKEVLVKNSAAGVGRPDSMVRSGIYPFLGKQPPMFTIGNESAGYVEVVGDEVTSNHPLDNFLHSELSFSYALNPRTASRESAKLLPLI